MTPSKKAFTIGYWLLYEKQNENEAERTYELRGEGKPLNEIPWRLTDRWLSNAKPLCHVCTKMRCVMCATFWPRYALAFQPNFSASSFIQARSSRRQKRHHCTSPLISATQAVERVREAKNIS